MYYRATTLRIEREEKERKFDRFSLFSSVEPLFVPRDKGRSIPGLEYPVLFRHAIRGTEDDLQVEVLFELSSG